MAFIISPLRLPVRHPGVAISWHIYEETQRFLVKAFRLASHHFGCFATFNFTHSLAGGQAIRDTAHILRSDEQAFPGARTRRRTSRTWFKSRWS